MGNAINIIIKSVLKNFQSNKNTNNSYEKKKLKRSEKRVFNSDGTIMY